MLLISIQKTQLHLLQRCFFCANYFKKKVRLYLSSTCTRCSDDFFPYILHIPICNESFGKWAISIFTAYNNKRESIYTIITRNFVMSGWPSGLRRQTQGRNLPLQRDWVFWSTYVGVGSNPTSDTNIFIVIFVVCFFFHPHLSKLIFTSGHYFSVINNHNNTLIQLGKMNLFTTSNAM